MQQDGRKIWKIRRGWQNARVWQTWQGCHLRVLSWSSLTLMFSGVLQKDLFKGTWSLAKRCLKQNYCHACDTSFAVFFPLRSCCVSPLTGATRVDGESDIFTAPWSNSRALQTTSLFLHLVFVVNNWFCQISCKRARMAALHRVTSLCLHNLTACWIKTN